MIVISRFRANGSVDIQAALAGVSGILAAVENNESTDGNGLYYNECGPEVVAVTRLSCFADIDKMESNEDNLKLGLQLINLGFMLHSVEYLREFKNISRIVSTFETI